MMKNDSMTDLSALAARGTNLDLLLAEVQGKVKVTKLKARKPAKQYLTADRVGGGGTRWEPANRAGHANRRLKAGAA
jgi:hypothetical protein